MLPGLRGKLLFQVLGINTALSMRGLLSADNFADEEREAHREEK